MLSIIDKNPHENLPLSLFYCIVLEVKKVGLTYLEIKTCRKNITLAIQNVGN